ncbi:MAG TPA: FtsX-like permease family protein [Dehalococcoidia bacterium]
MTSFLGIPLDVLMVILLVLLAGAALTMAYVALRNRIIFKMGLRNVPRRKAQTALILMGLMLSTLIVAAALTTGDTVNYSISNEVYRSLRAVDEIVSPGRTTETGTVEESSGPAGTSSDEEIPAEVFAELDAWAATRDDIDGFMPVLSKEVTVLNQESRQSEPRVNLLGIDPSRLDAFGGLRLQDGSPADVAGLGPGRVLLNESAAEELAAEPGEAVLVFYQNRPVTLEVAGVVEDQFFSGHNGPFNPAGMVMALPAAQEILGKQGVIDFIAVSNRGGQREGVELTAQVTAALEDAVRGRDLAVVEVKEEALEQATTLGNQFANFFTVLGLFAIAAGVLLIFLIFTMLAAERKSEMGMARAVGMQRRHLIQSFMSEGMAYDVASAAIGALLGVVTALVMVAATARLFAGEDFRVAAHVEPRSVIIAYCMGVVLTFAIVTVASWRVSRLNIVRAIRDLPDPKYRRARLRTFLFGVASILLGVALAYLGLAVDQAFPFSLGVSLVPLGAIFISRYIGVGERLAVTVFSALLLAYWVMPFEWLDRITGTLNADIEMFFLSGIMMVLAATLLIVYNAQVLLGLAARLGGPLGGVMPALRMAVAYPLDSRFRTGVTVAMFGLIIFALVMMSAMFTNLSQIFTSADARGEWDIAVVTNPNNPVEDLQARLSREDGVGGGRISAVGSVGTAGAFREVVRVQGRDQWRNYVIRGVDDDFLAASTMTFQTRARGYETDQEIWEAMRRDPSLAVVDALTVQTGGFGVMGDLNFKIPVSVEADTMDPIPVEVRDPDGTRVATVTVIGVLTNQLASERFLGVYLHRDTLEQVFGPPARTDFFLKVTPGTDTQALAQAIEASLVENGVQATSLVEELQEQQAQANSFLYLIQGFMSLGLLVGIAALGVIAFRSVIERRQHIGVLRAIGYQRSTVGLTFILESSFIALAGVLAGTVLGLTLAYRLVTSDVFGDVGEINFTIPWGQILLFTGLAYGASLVTTVTAARTAARIPIAEALRYE